MPDDPRHVARPARQDEGVEAARDETPDMVRDVARPVGPDEVYYSGRGAVRGTGRDEMPETRQQVRPDARWRAEAA